MIEMHGVSKTYNMGGDVVRALDNVSIRIKDGEFVSIVGPSGSGKSTMMNIIGCLDIADEGKYLLDGQSVTEYSEDELARFRNRKLGFVFQNFNLLSRLTALQNVELPLIYQGLRGRERTKKATETLDRMGLLNRIHHKPTELSGGQQQRVAIARALVTDPSVILADEPTGNLDQKTGAEIMQLFHELNRNGNTIVLITHDPALAAQAGRQIRILDGRVAESEERS
ncbi:MAG: ABC transporter ATP-binding protein [Bacillota bacterium]